MSPLLEAREIVVRFGGLIALDNVSLAVDEGRIVGLIGPNGAGKTTLFGVLSGLLRPSAGVVTMDGDDVTRASPQKRARRGLARTFQRLELFGELTVREHLVVAYRGSSRRTGQLVLDLVGLGSRSRPGEDETIDEIIAMLGLSPIVGVPAAALGLGTGRLVEIARALATRPRVLLLDEPSSGLDQRETEALASVLRQLRAERGVAIVLVEHDVEMVLGVADAVTVLDFGRTIATGAPAEIRRSEIVQAAYLGSGL